MLLYIDIVFYLIMFFSFLFLFYDDLRTSKTYTAIAGGG